MTKLTLNRRIFTQHSTIGELLIDGKWQCWTLEDVVRKGEKIPGHTAIPEGHYEVILSPSNRFKRLMPYLLNVPNFTGIMIHPGNTDADTHGCILVGQTRNTDFIGASKLAFNALYAVLTDLLALDRVFITVTHIDELTWP
jgi:hypothetical protein